jgi:DNA-3-methyladenine glycosylase II
VLGRADEPDGFVRSRLIVQCQADRPATCVRLSSSPWYDPGLVSPVDYARARRLLLRTDPVLAALIRAHGPCGLADGVRIDHFAALARSIIFQQLSTKAASTIHARLVGLLPDGKVTAPALVALTEQRYRSVGISRQKSMYLRDLSEKTASGVLALDGIEELDDEGVIAALTTVKGVGRWTAEMFLMFRLHRPDVLPVGDLGILTAVQRAYGMRKRPTPERLRKLGDAWKPYRSIACWYLWRSLDNGNAVSRPQPRRVRRRGGSSDPPSR